MARRLGRILVADVESTCWEGEPPPGQMSEIPVLVKHRALHGDLGHVSSNLHHNHTRGLAGTGCLSRSLDGILWKRQSLSVAWQRGLGLSRQLFGQGRILQSKQPAQ